MNTLLETLRIGGLRSRIELKQFMRQRESVVFTLFFPVILLFIFGTVFKDTIAPGVTFSQYFVAGMIASGLVNTGFQQLAITIPMERDDGTLKAEGKTILLTTHYLDEAQALADRVGVINNGQIIEIATPQTLGGRNNAPAKVTWLENGVTNQIHTKDPTTEVLKLSQRFGGSVPELEVLRPNLEEIYLKMIGELR